MPTVFISYVRENDPVVQRLVRELTSRQIKVWLDKRSLAPGSRWKDVIRRAISTGDFFIACFSDEYSKRSSTYMNEELILAVEELRRRSTDRAWFIPVLLSEDSIPDRNIGGGETLRDIQGVALYADWNDGIKRIISVIQPNSINEPQLWIPKLSEEEFGALLYRITEGKCTPFIGPAINYGRLPDDTSTARDWAAKYNYPEGKPLDLAHVAQFLAETDDALPKALINRAFVNATPPDFSHREEPYAVLSVLPLPVYVSTNYDDFLVRALQARGKTPKRAFHRWNRHLRRLPSVFDDSSFEPTVASPLVFHLYGVHSVSESMVITEDDHRQFLSNTSAEKSLPLVIEKALTATKPLFIGYDPSEQKFQDLLQVLVPYLKINLLRPADGFQLGRFRIPKYLENQFVAATDGMTSFRAFFATLRKRWEDCQVA